MTLKTTEYIRVDLNPLLSCIAVATGKAIIELKTRTPTILMETDIVAATKIENI